MNRQSLLKRPLPYAQINVTLWLIVINVLVFFMTRTVPQVRLMALVPLHIVQRGYIWQFVTYMFVHANTTHILFNMLALFFFGNQTEQRMGSYEFLLYYLLTGTLAGVFSFFVYVMGGTFMVMLVGASGAVFAVLLAFATYYPDANVYIMGIIPIRAAMLVIIYTAIEIFNQVFFSHSGVAHLTHLAGFGFGFFYFIIRLGINPYHRLKPPSRGGFR